FEFNVSPHGVLTVNFDQLNIVDSQNAPKTRSLNTITHVNEHDGTSKHTAIVIPPGSIQFDPKLVHLLIDYSLFHTGKYLSAQNKILDAQQLQFSTKSGQFGAI